MAVIVTGIVILMTRQISSISYYLNTRSLENLISHRAEILKGQENSNIRTLHALANIMGDYESIKTKERRDYYDNILRNALGVEPQMTALYTVWKPNAIDNMDSENIGRIGSSPSGQYAMAYFRETNKITGRTSSNIDSVIAHINGHNAYKDRVDNPVFLKVKEENTLIIRMMVPIINNHTKEVVGGLGCFLAVEKIQQIVENTKKTNNEIVMMAIYSGNGTIMAHYKPERIGKRMLDVDIELGDSRQELFQTMQAGKPFIDTVRNFNLKNNMIFVTKSFPVGNSGHNWSMLIGIPETYVFKEVKAITGFIIILAVMAILVTAVIIFVILEITTKPIGMVTDMLKDISEGKGDLTRSIPEKGNDEITAMSHWFNLALKRLKSMVLNIKRQAAILSEPDKELSGNMV
jgi:methyl-accepting chemotaxis protein